MKKNKQFQVKNLLWVGLFVGALLVASVATNYEAFKAAMGQNLIPFVPSLPNPAPPAQLSAGTAPLEAAPSMGDGINRILAAVQPAVVSITRPGPGPGADAPATGGVALLGPSGGPSESTGSGVIVDERGYVLTTFQTVGKATLVKVGLSGGAGRSVLADVVAVDTATDLALLKLRSQNAFPAVPLGNSDALAVGDIVFAVGNPFGFTGSVTMGIVSSDNRKINVAGVRYPDLIQTDAAVNEGNDGGPLINLRGEVVGINMACVIPDHRYSGIGFAVPINDAASILAGKAR